MFKTATLIVAMLIIASCAPPPNPEHGLTLGAFLAVDRLEDELTRGVSTKSDVERLLGKPTGAGAALMATTDEGFANLIQAGLSGSNKKFAEMIKAGKTGRYDKREMWFYDDQTANILGSGQGVIRMRLRMQMLMVYFYDDLFDGFMWFSNAGRTYGSDPLSSKP
jgi:hypothetical protein